MSGIIAMRGRENLFQEIFNALRQWPELERRVFYEAHYRGQSAEAISRSLQLDVQKVSAILQQCDSLLHASLRNFRKSGGEKPPLIPDETVEFITARALASRVSSILDSSKIPA